MKNNQYKIYEYDNSLFALQIGKKTQHMNITKEQPCYLEWQGTTDTWYKYDKITTEGDFIGYLDDLDGINTVYPEYLI